MSIFGKLIKVGLDVAITLPVAVVKDVATLGGVVIDKPRPYTVGATRKLVEDTKDVRDELEDL